MKLIFAALFGLFIQTVVNAQLNPNFSVSVSIQHETCDNNGLVEATTHSVTPNSEIVYELYKLPNVTTPIIVTNNTLINGLDSGNYQLKVTETLDSFSQFRIVNFTLNNQTQPFDFSRINIQISEIDLCNQTATLTVNTIANTSEIISYEITNGPVIFSAQNLNEFHNLPEGIYTIKTIDVCGRIAINQYTISIEEVSLQIQNTLIILDDFKIPNCNTITVLNNIVGNFDFPIQRNIIVRNPAGTIVYNQTQTLNNTNDLNVDIPFFNDESYSYDVIITDNCGNTFSKLNNIIDESLDLKIETLNIGCEKFNFSIIPEYYYSSYTIEFINVPPGFIPEDYNANYPNSFTEPAIFSSVNGVPPGFYTIKITDECGVSKQRSFNLSAPDFYPLLYNIESYNCDTFLLNTEENSTQLVSVIITNAPANFPFPLPYDASNLLNMGILTIELPYGLYTIEAVDDCGLDRIFTQEILKPNLSFSFNSQPGCNANQGGLLLHLEEVPVEFNLANGPIAYSAQYPINVLPEFLTSTENNLLLYNLPVGDYTFEVKDDCGEIHSLSYTVITEIIEQNYLQHTEQCGSFSVEINYITNVNALSFGMQKFNESLNEWVHPNSNQVNGFLVLENFNNTFNLQGLGIFRIVKFFTVFENACNIPVYEFEITGVPKIESINHCLANNLSDVIVEATGVQPLTYRVVEKNGNSFIIDNGNQNIFLNLENATYLIEVEDNCGNSTNQTVSINELQIPAISAVIDCDTQTLALSVYQAEYFDYAWVNISNPATVLSTSNQLIIPNFTANDLGTYQVTISSDLSENCNDFILQKEITSTVSVPEFSTLPTQVCVNSVGENLPLLSDNMIEGTWSPAQIDTSVTQNYTFTPNNLVCAQSISLTIESVNLPQINLPDSLTQCTTEAIILDAGEGHSTYIWNTGETTQTIEVSQAGLYEVTVSNTVGCVNSESVEVTFHDYNENLVTVNISANSIEIINLNLGNFEYSLDGINFQDSNIFQAPFPNPITLTIKNKETECIYTKKIEIDEALPNIITPNNDGINEGWNFPNIIEYSNAKIYIYDRYGKKVFESIITQNPVWEARYLNNNLHTTTYWYRIELTNSNIIHGYIVVKNRYKK